MGPTNAEARLAAGLGNYQDCLPAMSINTHKVYDISRSCAAIIFAASILPTSHSGASGIRIVTQFNAKKKMAHQLPVAGHLGHYLALWTVLGVGHSAQFQYTVT